MYVYICIYTVCAAGCLSEPRFFHLNLTKPAKTKRDMKNEVQNGPAQSARQWGSTTRPQNEVAFWGVFLFVLSGAPFSKKTVFGSAFSSGDICFIPFSAHALFVRQGEDESDAEAEDKEEESDEKKK